jgi:hypothetical protein
MADPAIKDRLESDFLTKDMEPDVKSRLDQCLASDPRHIVSGKRDPDSTDGRTVTLLQEALNIIRREMLPAMPEIDDEPGDYGTSMKSAVLRYKSDPSHRIQRSGQALDNVIGRMTLTQIDNDLLQIQGKKPAPPPAPSKSQDVYIKIFGFDNPSQQGTDLSSRGDALQFAKEINDQARYLDTHAPLRTIWFVGGEKPNPTDTIVARVDELNANKSVPLGKVFISGGSAGGKNVLQVAAKLSQRTIPVFFLGLWDAAFQRADLVDPSQFDRPENFDLDNPRTLRFKGVVGGRFKDCFFQSWGHCLDKSQEVHGAAQGFVPLDLTNSPQVNAVKRRFAATIFKTGSAKQRALEDAHGAAFRQGQVASEFSIRIFLQPQRQP